MLSSKRIALVAHDATKPALLAWAERHRAELIRHELYATGTTGKLVSDVLGVEVTCFESGPLGGDQQLGARIAEGGIDVLIFFWDPLTAQPHDPDVRALLRLTVVWNVPMACNEASADYLLSSPLLSQPPTWERPDFAAYRTRNL